MNNYGYYQDHWSVTGYKLRKNGYRIKSENETLNRKVFGIRQKVFVYLFLYLLSLKSYLFTG